MLELNFTTELRRQSYMMGLIGLFGISVVASVFNTIAMVGATNESHVVQGVFSALAVVLSIIWIMGALLCVSWIVRRARTAGNVVLLSILGLVVPFGAIILGFLPPKS